MTARNVVAVARHDLLDLRRQRGVWSGLLLIPFITVTFLSLLPGVVAQRERASQARATFRVAVQAATDAEAETVVAAMGLPGRFLVRPSSDARADVAASRADVGMRFDADAIQRLAEEESVRGEVVLISTRTRSRTAFAELAGAIDVAGLRVTDRRLEARRLAPATARPFVVDDVDLSTTPRGRRLDLATLLPLLVLLPLSGIVGVAAQRISGSKDQRVFEPLLVLPLTRTELLLGKAAASWTIGTISLAAVSLPLLAGRAVPVGVAARSIEVPLRDIALVTAIAVLLLTLLVGLGVAVGAASRTSAELGSVLQLVTLPLFLMASFLQFRSDTVTQPVLLVVPVLGVLLCIRDVGIEALSWSSLAVAAAASAGWTALTLTTASRFLRSERSVVRATS